jgi:hypothetical protein
MDHDVFVKRLSALGVTFNVSHPAPGGSRTLDIPADDLERFERDPIAYFAKRHRVTSEQHLDWHAIALRWRPCRAASGPISRQDAVTSH